MEWLHQFLPQDIISELMAIRGPWEELGDDSLVLKHSPDGTFNIKSAYEMLSDYSPSDYNSNFLKPLWKWPGPPRIKLFLWKVMLGKLLCNAERRIRNMSTENNCTRCHDAPETVIHVL
ncbi:Reverse transcriptase zinc-binding domain [Sesbania bispinosa]|nr:Reverse transcriptase zinc-binding domain [Sesbania bispinosa]